MRNRIGLIAAAVALSASVPALATQDGTSTATFLRIGQGARAEGMGGAFTAIANDANAIYWNPAGLGQITRRQVSFTHLAYIEKTNTEFASGVLPINRLNGSLGAAITYADFGTIDRRDSSGLQDGGQNKVSAYSGTVSWGQAVGNRAAYGLGAKFFNQNLAGDTGSGVAADLGGLFFVVPERLSLALSGTNIGPQVKTGTMNEDLPMTFRVGSALYAIPDQLTFALDLEKERATDPVVHLGGEYIFQGRYIARAGYQDTKDAKGGLSAGLGFIWRPGDEGSTDFFGHQDNTAHGKDDSGIEVRIDYAYVDYGDFDATHRIGVLVAF